MPQPQGAHGICWVHPDLRVGVQGFRCRAPIIFPLHSHPEYSIVFCTQGFVQVEQLGLKETVRPGEVIVGNAHVPHASHYAGHGEECQGVTLTLEPATLREWLNGFDLCDWSDQGTLVLSGKVDVSELMPAVARLLGESDERKPGYRLMLEGLAKQLAAEVFRRWPRAWMSTRKAPQICRQLPRHQFVKAVEYMNSCGKSDFRVEDLCDEVGSSVSRFTQRFRESTQTKPLPFFNRIIVERAKRSFADSGRPVKDVAYGLGFRSVSHFCTLFKGITGLSPQEYLQQHHRLVHGAGNGIPLLSNSSASPAK